MAVRWALIGRLSSKLGTGNAARRRCKSATAAFRAALSSTSPRSTGLPSCSRRCRLRNRWINWARARLLELPAPDAEGHTHRVTLAFDTQLLPTREGRPYLAPSPLDMQSGEEFALTDAPQAHWRIESSGHIGKIVLKVEE